MGRVAPSSPKVSPPLLSDSIIESHKEMKEGESILCRYPIGKLFTCRFCNCIASSEDNQCINMITIKCQDYGNCDTVAFGRRGLSIELYHWAELLMTLHTGFTSFKLTCTKLHTGNRFRITHACLNQIQLVFFYQ